MQNSVMIHATSGPRPVVSRGTSRAKINASLDADIFHYFGMAAGMVADDDDFALHLRRYASLSTFTNDALMRAVPRISSHLASFSQLAGRMG